MQLWSKTLNRNVFVAKIDCGGASDPLVDQSSTSVLYWNPDDNKWEWAYIGQFEPPHEPETVPQANTRPASDEKEFDVVFELKARNSSGGGFYIKASDLNDLLRNLKKYFNNGDELDIVLGNLYSLTVSYGDIRYHWQKAVFLMDEWDTIANGVTKTFKEVFGNG